MGCWVVQSRGLSWWEKGGWWRLSCACLLEPAANREISSVLVPLPAFLFFAFFVTFQFIFLQKLSISQDNKELAPQESEVKK